MTEPNMEWEKGFDKKIEDYVDNGGFWQPAQQDFQFKVNGEDCSVCGIRAFDHYHPDKTKAKEFTMTDTHEVPDPRAETWDTPKHSARRMFSSWLDKFSDDIEFHSVEIARNTFVMVIEEK